MLNSNDTHASNVVNYEIQRANRVMKRKVTELNDTPHIIVLDTLGRLSNEAWARVSS